MIKPGTSLNNGRSRNTFTVITSYHCLKLIPDKKLPNLQFVLSADYEDYKKNKNNPKLRRKYRFKFSKVVKKFPSKLNPSSTIDYVELEARSNKFLINYLKKYEIWNEKTKRVVKLRGPMQNRDLIKNVVKDSTKIENDYFTYGFNEGQKNFGLSMDIYNIREKKENAIKDDKDYKYLNIPMVLSMIGSPLVACGVGKTEKESVISCTLLGILSNSRFVNNKLGKSQMKTVFSKSHEINAASPKTSASKKSQNKSVKPASRPVKPASRPFAQKPKGKK